MQKGAIVTGGASGIGFLFAQECLRYGLSVLLVDINDSALDAAREALAADAPRDRCEILVDDVSESQTLEQAVTLAVRKWGGLELLVNNAGIGADGEFEDVPPEAFDRVVDVNFKGVVNGCRAAWHTFRQQGRGKIINVSSLAGILPGGLMTSYSASKWAVTGFTTKKWSTYLEHPQNQRKPGRFPQAEACLPAIRRVIRKDAGYRPYAKTVNHFMMYIF